MDEAKLRSTIAKRLTEYRKLHGFTQVEVAEKLNYTDKSVSKWERGDGVPDIFVLSTLAELYSVTVNDLISEGSEPEKMLAQKRQLDSYSKLLITCLSVGLAWLLAIIVFFTLKQVVPTSPWVWRVYVCALPVSAIVAVVFSCIWYNIWVQFACISGLIWSVAVTIHLCLMTDNILWIYLVAAMVWLLMLLWTLLRRQNYKFKELLHRPK